MVSILNTVVEIIQLSKCFSFHVKCSAVTTLCSALGEFYFDFCFIS